jgi:Phage tail assembly chaperone protein
MVPRFVKVVNSIPQPELYEIVDVSRLICKQTGLLVGMTEDRYICNPSASNAFFIKHGFFPIKEIEEPHEFSTEQLYYCERVPVSYVMTLEDTCAVTFRYMFQPYLVEYAWDEIRANRTKLLNAADWVLNSKEVTQLTKLKYAAYIKILRDITDIYEYPQEVILPSPPVVEYLPRYTKTEHRRLLTEDEVATIKDSNLSMDFYKLWESTNFNLDFEYVKSLYVMNSATTTDVFPVS